MIPDKTESEDLFKAQLKLSKHNKFGCQSTILKQN